MRPGSRRRGARRPPPPAASGRRRSTTAGRSPNSCAKRRIDRDEQRVRQRVRPGRREVDQVVPVGAQPMAQHDKLLRRRLRGRSPARSIEFRHAALPSSVGADYLVPHPHVHRHPLRAQPDRLPASRPRVQRADRLAPRARGRRAVPAAAGGHRPRPLPPGIRRGDPGGPGVARPRLGRRGARAVGASAGVSRRAGRAGGTRPAVSVLLHPRRHPREVALGARRTRRTARRSIPAPAARCRPTSAPPASPPASATRCGSTWRARCADRAGDR